LCDIEATADFATGGWAFLNRLSRQFHHTVALERANIKSIAGVYGDRDPVCLPIEIFDILHRIGGYEREHCCCPITESHRASETDVD